MKAFITTILVVYSSLAVSQVIPDSLLINWSQAGLLEDIPEPSTVVDFLASGGNPDGVTANDAIINSLISGISEPTIIYFPTGTYYFTNHINLKSGIILRGASSDSTQLLFNLTNQNHLIRVVGGAETDTLNVAAPIAKDSLTMILDDVGNLSIGDFIFLFEEDQGLVFSIWAEHSTGQINQIQNIDGNEITFFHAFRRNYSPINNPRIIEINPIQNVGIENLSIERVDITANQTSNLRFTNAINCRVKCIESNKCNYAHIEINRSSNIEISGSFFHDAFDFGDGGKAYGVMITQTSGECLIKENIFDSLRHAMILQAGANGNAFIYNYSINPYWTEVGGLPSDASGDIVLHGNYPYRNLFEANVVQNIIIDNSHEYNGPGNMIFRNRAELYGIVMNLNASLDGQIFIGNEITNPDLFYGNYILTGTDHFEYGNHQLGNTIPVGTDDLTVPSIFYESVPFFYDENNSWPPIGFPNELNEHANETQVRYSENSLTKCQGDSLVSGFEEIYAANFDIILFPNPTSGELHIVSSLQLSEATLGVYNLSGIKMIEFPYRKKIDLNFLEPGLYFMKVTTSSGLTINRRFIVQN